MNTLATKPADPNIGKSTATIIMTKEWQAALRPCASFGVTRLANLLRISGLSSNLFIPKVPTNMGVKTFKFYSLVECQF